MFAVVDYRVPLIAATLALAAGLAVLLAYRRSTSTRRRPTRRVGTLSQINLYPIKSGPALYLTHAECTPYGLKYRSLADRRFVIVGKKSFISVRQNLKLTSCSLEYKEETDELVLSAPGTPDLIIPVDQMPEYNEQNCIKIPWYDNTETVCLEYGEKYSNWLTDYLGENCKLGYFHPVLEERRINLEHRANTSCSDVISSQSKLMYQNSHPYLIASQASLDDLNTRLDQSITFQSFRPNLVVQTEKNVTPYEEDEWRQVAIGEEAILYNERPCPRCPMIYVDYKNGEMRKDKEPMTTLLRYRRREGKKYKSKTVFGINSSTVSTGEIKLGDAILVASSYH